MVIIVEWWLQPWQVNTLNLFFFIIFPTSSIRAWLWELLSLKGIEIEGNSTSMIKLNNSNWVMWKFMMEDFLTIRDLLNTLEGQEVKRKDISYFKWNKMNKNTIAYIKQWIDTSSCHHVANETNAYNL